MQYYWITIGTKTMYIYTGFYQYYIIFKENFEMKKQIHLSKVFFFFFLYSTCIINK